MIGKTVSHYKIVTKLGEGGMGVVYLAEDVKLNRKVAIKFLPHYIAGNTKKRERFETEAKAAAALNHTNIATIYNIEEADGEIFIVMEYIDGHTISGYLTVNRVLSIDNCISITTQIAKGLRSAHDKGIIHRDIKSDNIMITESGEVKIMDFGLAKMSDSAQITQSGDRMGTAAYMSPEQIAGKELDHRTDIWSFGVVLYEILTGQLPFTGDNAEVVIYSIISKELQPLSNIRSDIPDKLEKIVKKCLQKNRADRYQSVSQLLNELCCLSQAPDSKHAKSLKKQNKISTYFNKKIRQSVSSSKRVVGFSMILILLYVVFLTIQPEDTPMRPTQVERLTSYPGQEIDPALSPDGKSIAFAWNGANKRNYDIYIKLVDIGNPVRLTTNPLKDSNPEWSPDGKHIAFVRYDEPKEIYIIPSLGGRERKIIEFADDSPMTISWSKDGNYIYYTNHVEKGRDWAIFRVSVKTSVIEQVTKSPHDYWRHDGFPRVSPDGKYIAFNRAAGSASEHGLWIKSLETDNEDKLIIGSLSYIWGMCWSKDSQSIIYGAQTVGRIALWKINISGGKPIKINNSNRIIKSPSVALNGDILAYEERLENFNIWKINLKYPHEKRLLIESTRADFAPDILPDGQKIVFSSFRNQEVSLLICNSDGTNQSQVMGSQGHGLLYGFWSPDGQYLSISAIGGQPDWITYLMRVAGENSRKIMNRSGWTNDGKWIYYFTAEQIFRISFDGTESQQLTKNGGVFPYVSRYDNYVYFNKNWDKSEIWRVPKNGGEEEAVFQVKPYPYLNKWVPGSKGLYFIRERNDVQVLEFINFETKEIKHIQNLSKISDQFWSHLALAPDESYLLYDREDMSERDIMLIRNFK